MHLLVIMVSKGVPCRRFLDQLDKLNVTKQLGIMQNLYIMWEDVGIDEEQELNRATQVWNYVFDLLNDIKDEEVSLIEEIEQRIINYEKKILVLNEELQLPKAQKFTGSLIQKEQTLRQLLNELSKLKHKRLREFQELHLQELKYCEILEVPPLSFPSGTGVPSEKDIYNLQQYVQILQKKKEERQQEFFKLKKELSTILELTELTPETLFEKEILTYQEDTLSLSMEKFQKLEQIVLKTKMKQAELENEKFSLMEKLSVLWDNLEINTKVREMFLSKHTDCSISNLDALRKEIARCEEIKKQNFSEYVCSLKEELCSLWDKCFILPSETMLPQFKEDEINKTVLENYGNELRKWRKYYEDIEHIVRMIIKRQELWDQMIIFENNAIDPKRFKNRGGNLLREERQRKQLQKELPDLEEKIIINIQNYEKKTGEEFLYYGEKFEDFMKKQWEDRLTQKENERFTKKKMRLKEFRQPPSMQSFSMTPKLLKSPGTSIFKTKRFSVSRQFSSATISHSKNERESILTKNPKKNILKEKNRNKLISECLDSTTYAKFVSKLNRSSRIYHRSSLLSSKMIVGTRTSINKKR